VLLPQLSSKYSWSRTNCFEVGLILLMGGMLVGLFVIGFNFKIAIEQAIAVLSVR
jgi:hypothetical protein